MVTWPPYSPDLTPFDFFLLGKIKKAIYVSPLSTTMPQLTGSEML
jgi:hypothetical protein